MGFIVVSIACAHSHNINAGELAVYGEKMLHCLSAYLSGPRRRHPVNVFERGHSGTTYRRLLQVSQQVPVAPEQAGQGVLVTVLARQGLRAVDNRDPVAHTEKTMGYSVSLSTVS
eukprot:346786-Pleurochrysis_carterae.AAC.1